MFISDTVSTVSEADTNTEQEALTCPIRCRQALFLSAMADKFVLFSKSS